MRFHYSGKDGETIMHRVYAICDSICRACCEAVDPLPLLIHFMEVDSGVKLLKRRATFTHKHTSHKAGARDASELLLQRQAN